MANEFKLPDVGEGIESGTVVGVLVSVGDKVEVDQPVLELETDKAVVEVPSSVSGVIQEIHVSQGDEAKVGQSILTVGEDGEAAEKPAEPEEKPEPAEAEEKEKVEKEEPKEAPKEEAPKEAPKEERPPYAAKDAKVEREGEARRTIPAAPSVRRLAREMGVDLREVEGSGLAGRISADDVRRAAEGAPAERPAAAAAPVEAPPLPDFSKWGEVERAPMSGIRKATVRQMALAWSQVPMVTHFDKADITDFEKLRKGYAPKAEAVGAKLTPTAMLIKVVAGALRKFPDFNASIDVKSNEVVYKRYIHIGVAVDTEHGLLVPVIKNADRKNIIELAKELGEIAEKARARKLGPDDMQGGTFSVSNLGGIGGVGFTPIVNTPEVAILGVSRGTYEPVWNREKNEFEPRLMMPLSVSYDHRLIDGASAARFLRWICTAIEDPFLMALEG